MNASPSPRPTSGTGAATDAPLFSLGLVVATPAALRLLDLAGVTPQSLLQRHVAGDFGDLDEEDRRTNHVAIRQGLRILSAYRVGAQRVYVITEAPPEPGGQRPSTCCLLVGEY